MTHNAHLLLDALATAATRVSVWADVLDRINVFPVADGDTGTNLALTLAPLHRGADNIEDLNERLLFSARGNSGNIAAQFIIGFLKSYSHGLRLAAEHGRNLAHRVISEPIRGTMLDVFDILCTELTEESQGGVDLDAVIHDIESAVLRTNKRLDVLHRAGVVDAGALGMLLFVDGFLKTLDRRSDFHEITDAFGSYLDIDVQWEGHNDDANCVEALIEEEEQEGSPSPRSTNKLDGLGTSMVSLRQGKYRKLHFHVSDPAAALEQLRSIGNIVHWKVDDMTRQTEEFSRGVRRGNVHIMTDAAGSLPRHSASRLGITLLDSYVLMKDSSVPETSLVPEDIYTLMRKGEKVSTSQASIFERHQHYKKAISLYDRVIYLCVGSVYTGNFSTAVDWKANNDPENKLIVVDTGAASGRLALVSILSARFALREPRLQLVKTFAHRALEITEEFIFLDDLRYLARGGRLSKASAFFGNTLRLKPIVSPFADGARKVGSARSRRDQVKFAFEQIERLFASTSNATILLQYTDNRHWLEDDFAMKLMDRYPGIELIVHPLSMTSGVHMGPGTWGIAIFAPPTQAEDMSS